MEQIIEKLRSNEPFALIKRASEDDILFLTGPIKNIDQLDEIPRKKGTSNNGKETFDTLSILPFNQVKELGFVANSNNEKILCMEIKEQHYLDQNELLDILPKETTTLSDKGCFYPEDADYAKQIRTIINEEIGQGEGCNFVIPRRFSSKIAGFSPDKALSIYANILKNEYGVYWSYIYFTGDRYFIGATPERHISCHNKLVKMNPISGTFRKGGFPEKQALSAVTDFVGDQKESFELLMVTDEELKMMAELCGEGGHVIGPLLKEMSKLIHTEYLLVGKSDRDIIDMLRESMFAATVVGSPIENACRVVKKHEEESRGYYGSALALIGRDKNGQDTLDSPITIRMADIKPDGSFIVRVGATLVRDSIPESEVAETYAKAEAVLSALGCNYDKNETYAPVSQSYRLGTKLFSEDLQIEIAQRNQRLSRFWIEKQDKNFYVEHDFIDKDVLIIDNEDSFTKMLGHMVTALGMKPRIIKYNDFEIGQEKADLFILGPGPGDPCNTNDPKIVHVKNICRDILDSQTPLLCVCLGHQILCRELGLTVEKKNVTFQGKQELIDLWGYKEQVGFYNTFVGKYENNKVKNLEVSYDKETDDIHALRGDLFAGVQFHPESILTNNGIRILKELVSYLLSQKSSS